MEYSRNRIYISKKEQQQIKNFEILIGGCGIGSVIAECALRIGFEKISIVDGDRVEKSNLNRQNYTNKDIGSYKTESLKQRLLAINPRATIRTYGMFLTKENISAVIDNQKAAINALDFQSDTPFVFDAVCDGTGIPVLHPYNLGWASLLFIVVPGGKTISEIYQGNEGFEKEAVRFFLNKMDAHDPRKLWIERVLKRYSRERAHLSPPQLSVGAWLLGGLCTTALFKIATGKTFKIFPEYYLLAAM